MKTKLKQVVIELEKASDGTINLAKMNSRVATEEFKYSLELQKHLNSYGMGSFNMACEDMRKYLEAKHPNLDRSFVDII